jgi:Tol biopolymer transport system component
MRTLARDGVIPSFSRDGKWVYFAANRNGRHEIHRVQATGGEPVLVTDNGGFVAFESMDGNSVFYTKTAGGCTPLFVRPLAGGPERQVSDSVCLRGFVVTERGIYHLSGNLEERSFSIKLLDPNTGRSSVVKEIEGRPYLDQGLAVSPDGKTILYAASTQLRADLMLVDNFR